MPTTGYSTSSEFTQGVYRPVVDYTGVLPANRITNERHTVTAASTGNSHFIIPLFAPFYAEEETLIVSHTAPDGAITILRHGIDYLPAYQFIGASRACVKPIYGAISFLNSNLAGDVVLTYQTLGGQWILNLQEITDILANTLINPRRLAWEQVIDRPVAFPPIDHEWNLTDLVGASDIVDELRNLADVIGSSSVNPDLEIDALHASDFSNPHGVTKAQVGLSNVMNYPMATQAQASDGSSEEAYMSPKTTAEMVDERLIRLGVSLTTALSVNRAEKFFFAQI